MEIDLSDSDTGKRSRADMEGETQDDEDMTEQLRHTDFPSVTATMLRRSEFMIGEFKKNLNHPDLNPEKKEML